MGVNCLFYFFFLLLTYFCILYNQRQYNKESKTSSNRLLVTPYLFRRTSGLPGDIRRDICIRKSVFKIDTHQDCIDAIEKVKNGYTPDQRDIEQFASAMQQSSVKDMVHKDFYERIKECSDPKYEMERIAEALYEAYEQHYEPTRTENIGSVLNG